MGCLKGIINGNGTEGLHMACLFDNEEVGSNTKQGAGVPGAEQPDSTGSTPNWG